MGIVYSLNLSTNVALPDEADENDRVWNVVDEDDIVSTTCSVICYDVGTLPPAFIYRFKHSDVKVFAVMSALFLDAKNSLFLYDLPYPAILSRRVSSRCTTRDVLRVAREYSGHAMAYERVKTAEDIPSALALGRSVACIMSWSGLSPRLRVVNGHFTRPVVDWTPGAEESTMEPNMPFVITGYSDDSRDEAVLYGYVMGEDMRVSLDFTFASAVLKDLWVIDLNAEDPSE